jgi:hypothetical protein
VVTGDPVNVTTNGAMIVGNSYSGIFGNINYAAVQYSMSPAMASPNIAYAAAVGSPYFVNLTGLFQNMTYYYRAVVNSSDGSHFGEIKTFTTLPTLDT